MFTVSSRVGWFIIEGPGSVKMVGGMRTFSTGGGQGVPAVEMDQDEMLLRVR